MKDALIGIISSILVYLIFSFIKMDIDSANWSENTRMGCIIMSMFTCVAGIGIFSFKSGDDDDD